MVHTSQEYSDFTHFTQSIIREQRNINLFHQFLRETAVIKKQIQFHEFLREIIAEKKNRLNSITRVFA